MDLGSLLVLLGVIFAVLSAFVDTSTRWRHGGLLTLAVILIGVGVLLGAEKLGTT